MLPIWLQHGGIDASTATQLWVENIGICIEHGHSLRLFQSLHSPGDATSVSLAGVLHGLLQKTHLLSSFTALHRVIIITCTLKHVRGL